jgi:4-amino-4-deoxy-L-arabinose transferase-like glycosyltransferase
MKKPLIFILGLAWACRLSYIFLFSHDRLVHIDEMNYYLLADGMLQGNSLNIFYHPPLYSFFLFWFFKIFGLAFPALQALQALLGVATCGLIFLVARRAAGERAGLLASLIYAVSFRPVRMPAELLSETLFTFLLIAAVWIFIKALKKTVTTDKHRLTQIIPLLALSGVLFGLAALTRSVALGLPFLLAVYFFIFDTRYMMRDTRLTGGPARFSHFASRILYPAVFLLAFSLPLIPWMARVYQETGRFMPGGFSAGNTFFWHNTELMWEPGTDYLHSDVKLHDLKGYSAIRGRPMPDSAMHPRIRQMQELIRGYHKHADQSDRLFRYTLDYLARLSLIDIINLELAKVYRLTLPFHPYYNPLPDWTFLLVLPFFLMAVAWRATRPGSDWRVILERPALAVLWLMAGYLLLSVLVFGGMPRYRDPFDPYIIIIAVIVGLELFGRLKSARAAKK